MSNLLSFRSSSTSINQGLQAVLITSFSHMHLSSDAKELLYKCTLLTAMMRRLTRVLFGHTFSKLKFQVNKNSHINAVKRGMYQMRRLILVCAIRTCYKCHSPCTHTAQLDPGDQIHFVDTSCSNNCLS